MSQWSGIETQTTERPELPTITTAPAAKQRAWPSVVRVLVYGVLLYGLLAGAGYLLGRL